MIQLGKDIMVEHATLFISKLSYTLQIDIPCKDNRNLIQFISIIYRGLVISQTSYLTSILLESYIYFNFCGPLFFKIIQILSNILSTISMRLSVAKPENFKKYYICMYEKDNSNFRNKNWKIGSLPDLSLPTNSPYVLVLDALFVTPLK